MTRILLLIAAGTLAAGHGVAVAGEFKAKPATVIEDATCAASAAWVTRVGLPDPGKSNHALLLDVFGAEPECAKAGAAVDGVAGITLTELGFDYQGSCSGESPALIVETTAGASHRFSCATADPEVPGHPSWQRVRSPFCPAGPATIASITLVFDDPGSVLVDNIDINGVLIGKPGNHHARNTAPGLPVCPIFD